MDYEQALAYMAALHRFGIKLGNERFEALMTRLANPQERYKIAHVAGTKGKGSTTAMIAAILRAHGFRTGGYFSPYVYDVRERVQVDGEYISREDFARLVSEIAPDVEDIERTDLGPTTEFELKTAIGFKHFAEREVDYAAIEVGLGGRLDATNVVHPLVSVITNIGLDHVHILGDTIPKIAAEKAGIIKPGIPVVTAAESEALDVIRSTAKERGCRLVRVSRDQADSTVKLSEKQDSFDVETERSKYNDLKCSLPGTFQRLNAATAIAAVEEMGFPIRQEPVREGLQKVRLPGRMQIVQRNPLVILDGGHNALAARTIAAEIDRIPHSRLFLVIGMVHGHDPNDVVGVLAPKAEIVFASQPAWHRAVPACEIARAAEQAGAKVETILPPLEAAREALRHAGKNDLVLITGSFYIVGDIPPDKLLA